MFTLHQLPPGWSESGGTHVPPTTVPPEAVLHAPVRQEHPATVVRAAHASYVLPYARLTVPPGQEPGTTWQPGVAQPLAVLQPRYISPSLNHWLMQAQPAAVVR